MAQVYAAKYLAKAALSAPRDLINAYIASVRPIHPTVLIFPALYQPWIERGMLGRRSRTTSAGADGQFSFNGMPAGDYLMVAVSNDLASDWRDPAIIQKLAAVATRITVTEGEKKAIDLTVSPVRR